MTQKGGHIFELGGWAPRSLTHGVYHIRLWANFIWNRCPTKLGWYAKWQKFLKCCRCYHIHNHLKLALRCFVWHNTPNRHCCEGSGTNSLQNKLLFPFDWCRNGGIFGVFSLRKRDVCRTNDISFYNWLKTTMKIYTAPDKHGNISNTSEISAIWHISLI